MLMDRLTEKYDRFIAVDRKTRVESLEFELRYFFHKLSDSKLYRRRLDKNHTVEVVNGDSTKLEFIESESIDLILLDAPCSATGSRPKPTNDGISDRQTKSYQKLQRKLIVEAIRILKPGGRMVYSTCSVLKAENEENVAFIEEKFGDKIKFEKKVFCSPFEDTKDATGGLVVIEREEKILDTIGFFAARFKKLE